MSSTETKVDAMWNVFFAIEELRVYCIVRRLSVAAETVRRLK
jgi:hypothetical protein